MESSTNGAGAAGAAVEAAAAGCEDQRGGAELGFVAGGRAAPQGVPGPERVPDPELVEQAKRRSFTAEYKARILAEADACTRPGEVGELLRREGLYTSHLTYWRKQRKDGALRELGRPRGRKPADTRDAQIAALTRRAERAEAELAKMKRVVEIQGNVSALLEEMLGTDGATRSTER
jgi:transposase